MKKYIVIYELPDTGYMECKGIYDNAKQAYGAAYLDLVDGLEPDDYYITLPEQREGENGYVFELKVKSSDTVFACVTVLFYEGENYGE